jgi:3-oxoacyl-[acyl-carrier protein] reductase
VPRGPGGLAPATIPTRMDLGIEGRVALVTGASKGLGLGVATALAREGARVAISARSRERIDRAADEIGVRGYVHDARNADGADELVRQVESDLGPIDILVANSGGPPASADPLAFTHEQWRGAYEMLLLGAIALVEAALPGMRERKWGRVLSLSSSVVREPSPVLVLSQAHRAGLLAALKTIARQVAADGVTVNSLLPGVIATDRARELGADRPERLAELPAGRLGTVDEFAAAAAFLCSRPAAYITGTTLLVDGGATRSL